MAPVSNCIIKKLKRNIKQIRSPTAKTCQWNIEQETTMRCYTKRLEYTFKLVSS